MNKPIKSIIYGLLKGTLIALLLFFVHVSTKEYYEESYNKVSGELYWKDIELTNSNKDVEMYKEALEFCQVKYADCLEFRDDFCRTNYLWLNNNTNHTIYDEIKFTLDNRLCKGVDI